MYLRLKIAGLNAEKLEVLEKIRTLHTYFIVADSREEIEAIQSKIEEHNLEIKLIETRIKLVHTQIRLSDI